MTSLVIRGLIRDLASGRSRSRSSSSGGGGSASESENEANDVTETLSDASADDVSSEKDSDADEDPDYVKQIRKFSRRASNKGACPWRRCSLKTCSVIVDVC